MSNAAIRRLEETGFDSRRWFSGAYTALHLERRLAGVPDVEIVLAAKENFVLFTPMLHEVAASDVAITDVVQPFRKMLHRTRVLIVEIKSIDLDAKRVRLVQRDLAQAFDLTYDHLVLALGRFRTSTARLASKGVP